MLASGFRLSPFIAKSALSSRTNASGDRNALACSPRTAAGRACRIADPALRSISPISLMLRPILHRFEAIHHRARVARRLDHLELCTDTAGELAPEYRLCPGEDPAPAH